MFSIVTTYCFFTVILQIFFLNKKDYFCQSYILKFLFYFVEHQLRKLAYYLSWFFFIFDHLEGFIQNIVILNITVWINAKNYLKLKKNIYVGFFPTIFFLFCLYFSLLLSSDHVCLFFRSEKNNLLKCKLDLCFPKYFCDSKKKTTYFGQIKEHKYFCVAYRNFFGVASPDMGLKRSIDEFLFKKMLSSDFIFV